MISYYPQWVVSTIPSITLSEIYNVSLVHLPDCLWSIMVFIMFLRISGDIIESGFRYLAQFLAL